MVVFIKDNSYYTVTETLENKFIMAKCSSKGGRIYKNNSIEICFDDMYNIIKHDLEVNGMKIHCYDIMDLKAIKDALSVKFDDIYNTNYSLLVVRDDIKDYLYKDIDKEALDISQAYDVTNEQFNILNHLRRGEMSLSSDDASLFFNVNDKGIGYFHQWEWSNKVCDPLVKLGLIHRTGKEYKARYYWGSDTLSGCFVAISDLHDMRKELNLPNDWWSGTSFDDYEYNGYSIKYSYRKLTLSYGIHTRTIDIPYAGAYSRGWIGRVMKFIYMIRNTKGGPLKEITTDQDVKDLVAKSLPYYNADDINLKSWKVEDSDFSFVVRNLKVTRFRGNHSWDGFVGNNGVDESRSYSLEKVNSYGYNI